MAVEEPRVGLASEQAMGRWVVAHPLLALASRAGVWLAALLVAEEQQAWLVAVHLVWQVMVLGLQGRQEWGARHPQQVAPRVRMAGVLVVAGRQAAGPAVLLGWAMWVKEVLGQALRAAQVEADQAGQLAASLASLG